MAAIKMLFSCAFLSLMLNACASTEELFAEYDENFCVASPEQLTVASEGEDQSLKNKSSVVLPRGRVDNQELAHFPVEVEVEVPLMAVKPEAASRVSILRESVPIETAASQTLQPAGVEVCIDK